MRRSTGSRFLLVSCGFTCFRRSLSTIIRALLACAPVAKLDKAPVYETGDYRFESCRVRHILGGNEDSAMEQGETTGAGFRDGLAS